MMPGPALVARTAFLSTVTYAHRGLHGPDMIENGMPAFTAALAAGYGIECDVRLSSDGTAFVFHDATLERLTEEQGRFTDRSATELDAIMLREDGPIPRLSTLLKLVAGHAPLLIEIKIDKGERVQPLCGAVRDALREYHGPVAVMSFHPGVSRWFATHAREVTRGLVVTEEGGRGPWGSMKRHLAKYAARPDFLAYDIRDLPSSFANACRRAGMPVLSWTVRSATQWETVRAFADAAIFEEVPEAPHG